MVFQNAYTKSLVPRGRATRRNADKVPIKLGANIFAQRRGQSVSTMAAKLPTLNNDTNN